VQDGQILWDTIITTGSNLTDIETRNHNDLQTIQGGTTAEYYHMTAAEDAEIARQKAVTSTAVSASMDDTAATWRVTADGQTLTLPAASTARIGNIWTVNFSTTGTLTIQRAGSDTIMTPTSATETSVVVTIRGTSLDFECASATTWIIV
jgi:hypothetical protein